MATAGKLQDDFLTCNICMEVYQEPVTLACQHSFCKNCLQKYLYTKTEALRKKTIPCPTCRQETPVSHPDRPLEEWAGQIKPALLLTGLMDSVVEKSKYCSMCNQEGQTTPASTWCADCQMCLCEGCLKLHNKVPTTRNHDVSKLSGDKKQRLKKRFMCTEHDKKVKLFCKDCTKSLCTVCCSISHRKCDNVVTIENMLPEVKVHLRKRQVKLAEETESSKAELAKYEEEVDEFLMKSASVKTDITKTVQDTVDYLRERESELLERLRVQTDQQAEKLRSKVNAKQTETQTYQHQSQSIQQALELEDETQLFEIYLSSGPESVLIPTEPIGETKIDAADVHFIKNLEKLREEIQKMDLVCDLLDLTADPVLHGKLDARHDGRCFVRDVVVMNISETKVTVLTDVSKNENLHSFYEKNGQKCSGILQLSNVPWCITQISDGKVAVSHQGSQSISIVAVTPDLKLLLTIHTSKKYAGLSALDQSTLVAAGSKSSPSVDLIDMKGNILKTFTSLPAIGKTFEMPSFIHVTRQGNILVSDCGLKSVICLTRSGDVVFTYTPTGDRALSFPRGLLCTRTGNILVADSGTHKVIHLSQSGDFIRDILSGKDGLSFPYGLCVDEDKLCVAVSQRGLYKYKFLKT